MGAVGLAALRSDPTRRARAQPDAPAVGVPHTAAPANSPPAAGELAGIDFVRSELITNSSRLSTSRVTTTDHVAPHPLFAGCRRPRAWHGLTGDGISPRRRC
jgi:hypothetical protein